MQVNKNGTTGSQQPPSIEDGDAQENDRPAPVLAEDIGRSYEDKTKRIKSLLSKENIDEKRLDKEMGHLLRPFKGKPQNSAHYTKSLSKQISSLHGLAVFQLEKLAFASIATNPSIKSTLRESASIYRKIQAITSIQENSFNNWSPHLFNGTFPKNQSAKCVSLVGSIVNFNQALLLLNKGDLSMAQVHANIAQQYLDFAIPDTERNEALDEYRKRIATRGGSERHKNTNDLRLAIKKMIIDKQLTNKKSKQIYIEIEKSLQPIFDSICENNWLQRNGHGAEMEIPSDLKKTLPEYKTLIEWIQKIKRELIQAEH